MRAIPLIAALALVIAACASVEKVGTASYASLPPTADVAVFLNERQIPQPFEVIGAVSYSDPGKFQRLGVTDSFDGLKAKAREIGANGVIIDHSEPIYSGIISRGIAVTGRAIRLETTKLPDAADSVLPPVPAPALPSDASVVAQGSAKDAADALRQLSKLHDEGIINDSEYESKKAEILRRM